MDIQGGDLLDVDGQLSLSGTWSLVLGTGFIDGGSTVLFEFGTLATVAGSLAIARINSLGLGFPPVRTTLLHAKCQQPRAERHQRDPRAKHFPVAWPWRP